MNIQVGRSFRSPILRGLKVNCHLESMGLDRLKEALEANDWDGGDPMDGAIDLEELEDSGGENDHDLGIGIDPAEMEAEMAGMKQAIYGGLNIEEEDATIDEDSADKEVEQLQSMMLKMQAVRGKTSCTQIITQADFARYGDISPRGGKEEIRC